MDAKMESFAELDAMAKEWEDDGRKYGGELEAISKIIKELLMLAKATDKMGLTNVSTVLVSLLIAIDMGPDDVGFVSNLLVQYYLNAFEDNLEEGELNLFNDEGKRVKLSDLGL